MLRTLLQGLVNRSEVTGAAIISGDGLLIDHALPPGVDGDALSALAATVVRQLTELGAVSRLGQPFTAIVEFAAGPAVIGLVEEGAALVVLAKPDADLGELLYLMRRQRPALSEAL